MVSAESTSNIQMVTPLPSQFLVAFSAPTIELTYWLLVQLESTCWRVEKKGNITIFTDSLSTLQALNSADPDQMIQGLHSSLAKLTVHSIPPVGACSCGTDGKRKSRQTCKNRQSGSADTESCYLQRGQDTSSLSV